MRVSEKLVRRKLPSRFPALARAVATASLVAFLLVQVPPGAMWYVKLFDVIQRDGVNLVGYMAATLVLITFCMRSMCALRLIALTSNLVFIAYGYLADLHPVLILHFILLPVNASRLLQLTKLSTGSRETSRAPDVQHP